VAVVPGGTGVLSVTVTAGQGTLSRIEFGAPRGISNASISVTGGPANQTGPFAFTPPAGQTTVQFSVSAQNRDLTTTVPLVITDGCGAWETFVGGGARSF